MAVSAFVMRTSCSRPSIISGRQRHASPSTPSSTGSVPYSQGDAAGATSDLQHGAPGVQDAVALVETARAGVSSWKIPRGVDTLRVGIEATFKRGRRAMRRAGRSTSDARVHEWRKAVKHLWYDVRLLQNASPSMLGPLADVLDGLAETLGDHHDLAVLVERLERDPSRFGGAVPADRVVALAREQQLDLWERASRLGATVYAESPSAFRRRIESYWKLTSEHGSEPVTETLDTDTGTDAVAPMVEGGRADQASASPPVDPAPDGEHTVERERKFLVAVPPDHLAGGTAVRQGYLADDGVVTVRVRHTRSSDGSGDGRSEEYTLTVKGGQGAVRTEIEWPIGAAQFAAAWPYTRDRRVSKTRFRIPFDDHVIELDQFHDALDGLVLAEVEFDSEAAMAAFEPPDWFGRDVTDDPAYSNASLATRRPTWAPPPG